MSEFDARNVRSISNSGSVIAIDTHTGQSQMRRMTTKIRIESISIAIVTAMPYAPARLSDVRKPATSAMIASSSIQLMNGT